MFLLWHNTGLNTGKVSGTNHIHDDDHVHTRVECIQRWQQQLQQRELR